jgi:hypothetical protein
MQIKSTLRNGCYQEKTIKVLVRMERKGTLKHCWWEYKLEQPLWKSVWRLLKKLKLDLPYDPVIPLLGIFLKEYKPTHKRDTCTSMFIAILTIHNSQAINQPTYPNTDGWIKKMLCIYIYNGVLFTHEE